MYRTNIPPKASGIYSIVSRCTGKQYIGSSIDLPRRRRQHFKSLRGGTHYNPFIQEHANEHGIDDLIFAVLAFCSHDQILSREQYYIDSLQPEWNQVPIAYSALGMRSSEEDEPFFEAANPMQRRTGQDPRSKMSKRFEGASNPDDVKQRMDELQKRR